MLPDGRFVFTARSGNQAVITFKVSADERTVVGDVEWSRKEVPSDRRECNAAFAKMFPGFDSIFAASSLSEAERKVLTAHALTHGSLPREVKVETVKGKTQWK